MARASHLSFCLTCGKQVDKAMHIPNFCQWTVKWEELQSVAGATLAKDRSDVLITIFVILFEVKTVGAADL